MSTFLLLLRCRLAYKPRLATESIAGRRPYQEDAVLTKELPDGRILVAVADGMGGHAAGDIASALAMSSLVEAVEKGQSLVEGFTLANQRVHTKSQEPGKQGMGTTMVAAIVGGNEFEVANVGDSRAYLLSGNGIRQISEDHSFVAEAIKRGQDEEEAMASRFRDALTRSIGIDAAVKVDSFGPFPVEENTALLLCSDGLYKVMESDRVRDLYGQSGGPRGAAQNMVATAFEDGSDDNISVAIAEFGEVPRDRPMGTMPIEFEPPEVDDSVSEDVDAALEPEPAPPVPESASEPVPLAQPTSGGFPVGLVVGFVVVVAAVAGLLIFTR